MTEGETRIQLLKAALPHIPFDGWGEVAFQRAARELDLPEDTALALFPGGVLDKIALHSRLADRELQEALATIDPSELRVPQRVSLGVMTRWRQTRDQREAIRRALPLLLSPQGACLSTQLLYETTDVIWRWAGDVATDWNHYSKRMILASAYVAALPVWLRDSSDDLQVTETFLNNRLRGITGCVGKMKTAAFVPGVVRRLCAVRRYRMSA